MLRKILGMLLLVGIGLISKAQDVQYSQFYAAPLYLNPALTGASELTRIGVNYRNQWPGLDYSFNSFSAYIDHYIFDYNSGIGLIFNANREGLANLSTNEIGLSHAYRLRISEDTYFRLGGQVSYMQRDAFFSDLVFGSQIDIINGGVNGITDELDGVPIDSRYSFFDFAFGGMFYTKNIWLGASAHHLTEPNVSFVEGQVSRLPMKLSLQGGIKFDLTGGRRDYFTHAFQERAISFAFNYKQQDPFNQLDIGTQIYLDPLVLGLWYRGLPTKNELPNNESVIALVGVSLPTGLDIGYSYDVTVSKLNQRNSGGAHEVSVTYSFLWGGDPNKRNQKARVIPCFRY
ncbi:MAG: PorP/SprF family type IX secretion system membrane protein [Bacteroidota bacterium]|uniref:Type IX secretion system membrane protein, PorP/SprF family n=1 Tax=Algoriphagus faecimaris TaxID=686796 RepID=A0A1G6QV43_9BACT|nr:type IX secretion system membrane protein PorP/SprF [Algoriphagus faecimaris]SDC95764.1 type IX secretion system membrane protein, PorP/SprF family [Algoriphagus faecimaris]